MKDEKLTTIAISKSIMTDLEAYLKDTGMSKKEYVEESVKYFMRHGFSPKDDVSTFTPMQEMIAEMEEKQEKRDQVIFTILQNIQNLQPLQALAPAVQKALPEIQKETTAATEAKLAYKRAKKALQNLCKNNKYSVRISRIKNILDEYFDI